MITFFNKPHPPPLCQVRDRPSVLRSYSQDIHHIYHVSCHNYTGTKDRHCVFKNSEENRREKSEESDVEYHVLGM